MISIVVPTHAPRDIVPLLEALRLQSGGPIQVLLVENGSPSARLRAAVGRLRSKLPLRHLKLERAGANAARNEGARRASGKVVAFTDDDCVPEPDWAERLRESLRPGGGAVIAGGPVRLSFESPPPRWCVGYLRKLLSEFDLGDTARPIEPKEYLVSANLAVLRAPFLKAGGFDPRAGVRGRSRSRYNDEFALLDRFRPRGVFYEPLARVLHRISPSRLSPRSFLERFRAQGRSDAALFETRNPDAGPEGRLRFWTERLSATREILDSYADGSFGLDAESRRGYWAMLLAGRTSYLEGMRGAFEKDIPSGDPENGA